MWKLDALSDAENVWDMTGSLSQNNRKERISGTSVGEIYNNGWRV